MALIAIGLGWVIGLTPVAAWSSPWWMGAAWLVAAAPLFAGKGPFKGRYGLLAGTTGAALVSGWLLHSYQSQPPPEWTGAVGESVTIAGTVISEPDRGETTTGYVIAVRDLQTEDERHFGGGKVLVQLNQYDRYLPGDRLVVEGKLEAPGGAAAAGYRAYLARQGISATIYRPAVRQSETGAASMSRWLTSQRLKFDRALSRSLPEPESSLAAGIAFGRDDGLSAETSEEFNRSGLRHLVAVSGSNVTLVAALMYLIAVPAIGRRWAWIPAGLAIAGYLGAAGLAPSVIRAGLMALTFLVGSVLGRPQSGMPALFAAVILMTGISPGLATDPGFLLSATATAGIIAFYSRIHGLVRGLGARRWRVPLPDWACQAAALTLASTLATTPILWVTFGRVSLISPIANLVVEPVFVLAFWASLATAAAGRVHTEFGILAGDLAFYPLRFIGWCAATFGNAPGSAVEVPRAGASLALAVYAVLVPVALLAYRFPALPAEEPRSLQRRRAASNRFVVAGAAGATLVAVFPVSLLTGGSGEALTVRFLDVGQGDAALITTPHGRQVLIDGGPSGIVLARRVSESVPHWDHSLDAVILSHPQEDHMAGLPELAARFSIAKTWVNGRENGTGTYRYFQSALAATATLSAGNHFAVDGVDFQVLWPPTDYQPRELNDTSLIVKISYGHTSFLFTGDSEAPVHESLIAAGELKADVLKVPHHGSKTTDPDLFPAVSPRLAVISVGAGNQFGHPNAATLEALRTIPVLRTDEHGTVTVRSDGANLRISTER